MEILQLSCNFYPLVLDEFQILEDLEEQTAMGGEEGSKHERFNRHQLDENVERRSWCVLEWVSDGVTDDGCLVWVRTLGSEASGMFGCTRLKPSNSVFVVKITDRGIGFNSMHDHGIQMLTSMYFLALSQAPPVLDAEIAI